MDTAYFFEVEVFCMSLSKLELKTCNYLFIENIDYEDIETTIKENLIGLCWGTENEEYYNINDVIDEFLERFERKSKEQKYGYIGEFLYYLYILQNVEIIKPVSVFFNQEERGFKKGFDLLAFDGFEFWYSEVKSGNRDDKDIDDYNIERLSTAYSDIKTKLAYKNRNKNYWDTAKSNICKIKLSDERDERKEIMQILTEDRNREELNNAIIVSVIFDDSNLPLNLEKIQKKYDNLKKQKENICIVCIRKKTVEKVIEILQKVRE